MASKIKQVHKVNQLQDNVNNDTPLGRPMNVDTISDDELISLFEERFQDQVASKHDISEFETACIRKVGNNSIELEVTIYGYAGSPTMDEFKAGLDGTESITLSRYDKGDLTLTLNKSKTITLSANDYLIAYEG